MNYFKIIFVTIFCFFSFIANGEDLNDKLTNKISKNIRCLVCQGQSVYDSQSDFAVSVKLVINRKIEEGYTEDQIYEYLKNQYGEWISYDTEINKKTYLLWLFPLFLFIFGGILIFRKVFIN